MWSLRRSSGRRINGLLVWKQVQILQQNCVATGYRAEHVELFELSSKIWNTVTQTPEKGQTNQLQARPPAPPKLCIFKCVWGTTCKAAIVKLMLKHSCCCYNVPRGWYMASEILLYCRLRAWLVYNLWIDKDELTFRLYNDVSSM